MKIGGLGGKGALGFGRLGLAALALAALLLALLLSLTGGFARLSLALDDAVLALSREPASFDDIAVIDFDDASLAALQPRLGAWPYGRAVHATLVDYLRELQVRGIVYDIVFNDSRAGDAELARALGQRADTVLAAAALTDAVEQSGRAARVELAISMPAEAPAAQASLTTWPALALPAPVLLASVLRPGGVGVVSTPLDADGRLRRAPLLHNINGRVYPSLALAALMTHDAAAPGAERAQRVGAELRWHGHRWPVDAQGRARLALASNAAAVPSWPASQMLAAALGIEGSDAHSGGSGKVSKDGSARLRQALQGRTVFVGSSAFLGDRVITSQGQMPGVLVMANVYHALAHDELLRSAGWPLRGVMLGVALLPCLWLVWRGRPRWAADSALAAATLALLAALTLALMLIWRIQFSALLPLSVALFGWLFAGFAGALSSARANRALQQERERADAANAAKSEFLASVSHELRTPLHAVLGMADALSLTPLRADQRRYVDVFRSAGATLASLIDDLLDLSRIEAQQLVLEQQPFDLPDLLRRQTALFEARAQALGLELRLQVDAGCAGVVVGDARRLAQVLSNLIGNALKFTRQGAITVHVARQAAGLVHIQVSDTGIGIARSKLALIFEPFVQADGSVSKHYGGTGLGLAITRRLVLLMGGAIWVESEPGAGSVFHFTAALPATNESPVRLPAPATLRVAGHAVQVLLVEDNEVNVLVIESMLLGTPHVMHSAANGEIAIEMFRTGRYGLVLMDVHMPGIDGHTATRALRRIEAEEARSRTPVLALSASAFDSDRNAAHAAGCDGHLAKPLSREQLLQAIATHGLAEPELAPPLTGAQEAAHAAQRHAPAALSSCLDGAAALARAGGDAARLQRVQAHAVVFLGAWHKAFQSVSAAQDELARRELCLDLQAVSHDIGALALAAAAAALAQRFEAGEVVAELPEDAFVLRELQRAVAALSMTAHEPAGKAEKA